MFGSPFRMGQIVVTNRIVPIIVRRAGVGIRITKWKRVFKNFFCNDPGRWA
jgi:hypothetical protein